MELKKELEKLKSYMGGKNEAEFKTQADYIRASFTSEQEEKEIDSFIESCLKEVSDKTEELIQEAETMLIRKQIEEISGIISMSYISKKYFGKSSAWIHQKINGYNKNDKPSKFTENEMNTFNFALQEISHKIGSISIH